MMNINTFNLRNDKHREDRISIESAVTFASMQREEIYDGDQLMDVFQPTNEQLTSDFDTERRDSGSSFDGEKLVKVFQKTPVDTEMTGFFESSRTMGRPHVEDRNLMKDNTIITAKPQALERERSVWEEEAARRSPLPPSSLPAPKTLQNSTSSKNNSDAEEESTVEYIKETRPYDIICGRNNGAHNCVGNRRFRVTIMMNLKRYMDAPSREEKSYVIKSVIDLLLNEQKVGARFIKKVGNGMYVRLKERQVREKVGHAFREMIALSEKESKKAEGSLHNHHNIFR